MSEKILNDVFDYSKSTGPRRLILAALAWMANDEGEGWTTIVRVAWMSQYSARTVRQAVEELQGIGELAFWDGAGHGKSPTRYQVVAHPPNGHSNTRIVG